MGLFKIKKRIVVTAPYLPMAMDIETDESRILDVDFLLSPLGEAHTITVESAHGRKVVYTKAD